MSHFFEVESVNICDFITQDQHGKSILVGVYTGELRFPEPPPAWPPFFFNVVLDPIERAFDFHVQFIRPDRRAFVSMRGHYAAAENPRKENRVVLNWQIAPVRFTGDGTYILEVRDGSDKVVFTREIDVSSGPGPRFAAELSGELTVDAEL